MEITLLSWEPAQRIVVIKIANRIIRLKQEKNQWVDLKTGKVYRDRQLNQVLPEKPRSELFTQKIITAPLSGKVLSISCKSGDTLESNQLICTIESMKMENEIYGPALAEALLEKTFIETIHVSVGDMVEMGTKLVTITASQGETADEQTETDE